VAGTPPVRPPSALLGTLSAGDSKEPRRKQEGTPAVKAGSGCGREPWKAGPPGKNALGHHRVLWGRARSDLPGERPGVDRVSLGRKTRRTVEVSSNRLCYVHCERLSSGSYPGRIAADTAVTRRSVNLRLVPEQSGENPDAERTGGSRELTLIPETGGALKGAGSDREIRPPSGPPYGRSELRPPVGASPEGIEPRGAGQVRACSEHYRSVPKLPSGLYRAPGMGTVTPRGGQ
jgi:hypothetical protein